MNGMKTGRIKIGGMKISGIKIFGNCWTSGGGETPSVSAKRSQWNKKLNKNQWNNKLMVGPLPSRPGGGGPSTPLVILPPPK